MSVGALKLQLPICSDVNGLTSNYVVSHSSLRARSVRQLRRDKFSILSTRSSSQSEPPISTELTSSVGSSSPVSLHLNITPRHLLLLNLVACSVAVSTTWLFFSAIPALLAFKRAAESLEKLLDVTREELPDTMAAVRLSGMEISDLTMELSDLGQEITQGVKSSTRAVRVAEEKLRQFSNMGSSATMQVMVRPRTEVEVPPVARAARNVKEGIVKGRAMLQMFFALTRYSKIILNYFASRGKQ